MVEIGEDWREIMWGDFFGRIEEICWAYLSLISWGIFFLKVIICSFLNLNPLRTNWITKPKKLRENESFLSFSPFGGVDAVELVDIVGEWDAENMLLLSTASGRVGKGNELI